MADLVLGIGTSHSPLLVAPPTTWAERAVDDRTNRLLYDETGAHRTYDELVGRAGSRFEHQLTPEVWEERFAACRAALLRLAGDIGDVAPDLVVIVGDDQRELFDYSTMPAIAVYWGDEIEMAVRDDYPVSPFWNEVRTGYAVDARHRFAAAPKPASHVIEHLMDAEFDVTACNAPTGKGFGHAYGFVVRALLGDRGVPVLPVMLNTYYPPNQPSPARCIDLGRALRDAIASLPDGLRVAMVASGGLSHFVVDEDLDRTVLGAFGAGDLDTLAALPTERLQAGSSEIRNWVTLAGAMGDLDVRWSEYIPCYRSPAGTGCGMAFARWS